MNGQGNELFACLNAINEKNPTYKYDRKKVSTYMLMLWLSLHKSNISCIDKINERLFDMPDELVYAAMYTGIPKGKKFVRWPKKDKKDKDSSKKDDAAIKLLMEEHGFSEFEAKTVYIRYIKS